MSDLTIYEVEFTYPSKMGSLTTGVTISEKVEGREQLDMVLQWLRDQGFDPTWSVYHAKGARLAIKQIAAQLVDFPLHREGK